METIDAYLERLASGEPVPGGGSAAALTGAFGAALVAMVGRIAKPPLDELVARADALRGAFEAARVRDEAAFAAVVAAQALPKDTDAARAQRRHALEAALTSAAQAPLETCALADDLLELADTLAQLRLHALSSDVGCAAELAYASLAASAYNVRINHRYMRDDATIRNQAARLVHYEGKAQRLLGRVRDAIGFRTSP